MGNRIPSRLPPMTMSQLPLARHQLDRDHTTRSRDDLFEVLLAQTETRVLLLFKRGALLTGSALALLRVSELPAEAARTAELLVYLGRTIGDADDLPEGTPIVAMAVTEQTAAALSESTTPPGTAETRTANTSQSGSGTPASQGPVWGDLRIIGGQLSDRDAGLLTQAVALANWHDSHRFSPQTGEPLTVVQGGWVRTDSRGEVFPRTDPAVIVAVIDDEDRILLGSNAQWESNRFSLLAGFVEAGESLEAAVIREVFEESGIRVVDPEYLGSQPWPFPASLMVGFTARVDPDRASTLMPDGDEILDLRWFTRHELREALDDIILPGRSSIARAILEHWYGGPIERAEP